MNIVDFLITLVITFLASTLTLLTGFGVGTVLTPTFMLFYDIKTAVLLVAVVHLANNILKFGLFMQHIDKTVLWRFGLISIAGALAGSLLQGAFQAVIVKYALGMFLVVSGIGEFTSKDWSLKLPRKFDILGGFFSGLMGGLIGNQGAIRSAYLLNYNLSKEAFIATATSIAIVIDLSRIPIYFYGRSETIREAAPTLLIATSVAFSGTLLGRHLLKKISFEHFRKTVAACLILVGIMLIAQPI